MSTFSTRDEAGVLVVAFNDPSGLNDFRNTPLRDSLFELVQGREGPLVALDMSRVDDIIAGGIDPAPPVITHHLG